MPRCYMVKKGASRHEGPAPRSPTEASVAPPCYSPSPPTPLTEPSSGDYAVLGRCPMSERSAADREAAHDLLSLAQSLPPLPPAMVTVLEPAPLLPVYTYTIQPTNIYILAEDSPYHAVPPVQPVAPLDYAECNYAYQTAPAVQYRQFNDILREQEVESQSNDSVQIEVLEPVQAVDSVTVLEPPASFDPELDLKPEATFDNESIPTNEQDLEPDFIPDPDSSSSSSSSSSESKLEIDEIEDEIDVKSRRGKAAKYSCSECGKRYATSSNLSRHKQTHRSLDSVEAKKCSECGKAYVSMPALAMHVLTHRMGHVCGVCGKQFSRPWLLRGHLRSHTGEKPYICGVCNKAFADRSNLRAHFQTHSSDKKYECRRCGKSFALKSYLNKHQEAACVRDDE